MINSEVALAPAERLNESYDLVGVVQEILTRENLSRAAEAMIDFAADYLTQFDAMNRQFTTLSADDRAEEGYNAAELDALTSASLGMTTLSADQHIEEATQKATLAQRIQHERHSRMVHFLLEEDDKKSNFSLVA